MQRNQLKKFKLYLGFAFIGFLGSLQGADLDWIGNTEDLLEPSNWNPAGPTNSTDNGIFNLASISSTASHTNNALVFSAASFQFPDARSFTFTVNNNSIFHFNGLGMVNTGGSLQIFEISDQATVQFLDGSGSAASSAPVQYNLTNDGSLSFFAGSTAGLATISNTDSNIFFFDPTTTAGSSIISQSGFSSSTRFTTGSTAGNSTINLDNSAALSFSASLGGIATITASNQSSVVFDDASSAESSSIAANSGSTVLFDNNSFTSATVITLDNSTLAYENGSNALGASITGTTGSDVSFGINSQGGASSINLTDSTLSFGQNSTAQGSNINLTNSTATFSDTSTASLSLTMADGGSRVAFTDAATAGDAVFDMDNSTFILEDFSTGNQSFVNLNNNSQLTLVDSATADQMSITAIGSSVNFTENSLSATSSIDLDAASSANFQQASNDTFNGILTGTGLLTKSGPGVLNFTATGNAFTGLTQISEGNFALNSSLNGLIVAGNAGTLSGIGTALGDVIIDQGGTISPGNSIGTFNIGGNFTQNPESTYLVELNGALQSDLIDVAGTATINGGIVNAVSDDGTYALFAPYTILHADGGVAGTYTPGVFLTNPLIGINLFNDPSNIFLVLGTNFEIFGETSNQRHVAEQFDGLNNATGDLLNVIENLLTLTPSQLRNALDQMGGEQYTSLVQITHQSTQRFLRRIYDPLRNILFNTDCYDPCRANLDTWFAVEGGQSQLNRDRNAHGYRVNNYNVNLGVQSRLNEQWTVGAAAAYDKDRIHYRLGGSGTLDYTQAALYGAYTNCSYYGLSNLVFGYDDCKVKRHIDFAEIDRKAHGKPKIFQTTFYQEVGKNYALSCFNLQPFVGLEVGYYRRHHFHESRADALNLSVKSRNIYIVTSRLGLHMQTDLNCGIQIFGDIAWLHNYNFRRDNITSSFSDFGNNFQIIGVKVGRDSLDGALTASKQFGESLNVYARLAGQVWHRYTNYSVTGGLNYRW